MTKKQIPKRRFSEFINDGAWEQRELGELADFNPKADLPDTFKYVDLESVVGTEMIAHRVENKATAPSRAQRLARQGDLFYQTVRPYQKNNYLLDQPCKDYVFSTGYAQMRPHNDGYFLLCLVQTEPFVKAVLDRCTGTSYPAINSNDLADIRASIPPDVEEENALGQFFRKLDNHITLHQRKLEKIKNLKSAYLSKMFPKEGEKYPVLRFAGFTDAWEQRELGSVAIIRTGYPFDSKDFTDQGEYLVITNGNIQHDSPIVNNSLGNRIDINNAAFVDHVLGRNEILVTMDGTVGRTAKVVELGQILAQRVGRLTAKSDPEFLYQLLNTGDFFRKMTLKSSGGTIKHISLSDIGSWTTRIPPFIDEQIKIGTFFRGMDDLIALHRSKLEKLNRIKKAYLNEMFV